MDKFAEAGASLAAFALRKPVTICIKIPVLILIRKTIIVCIIIISGPTIGDSGIT